MPSRCSFYSFIVYTWDIFFIYKVYFVYLQVVESKVVILYDPISNAIWF